MARADDTELIDKFEEFYRSYYRNEIGELAQKYPSEQKSLYIDWQDLYRFDPDLADDFRNKPKQLREYAEEALRLYDLPVDVSLGQAHVRVRSLPDRTAIREIRADHRGMLIAVQGIVRKATDVRPKITNAAFECQRCGTLSRIPQESGDFQEPHECQGCERQGPFRINYDQSEFIDAQKLRVQESPEGLRGGETPQNIDVNIEDDITGEVTAGDHVMVTGILNLEQQGNDREKSPMFDVYMEGLTVEIEDEQFEEMDITDEDKKRIVELSNEPDIYEQMEGAIAPSIYGYEMEKRAMAFQLFSGVTKFLPDESRTRGDIHVLLIGDPGTGKSQLLQYIDTIAPRSVFTSGKGASSAGLCVVGDTRVHTEHGFREIRDVVEEQLPDAVDSETSAVSELPVYTFDRGGGALDVRETTHVWRMPEKPCRRIETSHGKELEASVNTPVLTCSEEGITWTEISDVSQGDYVAVPEYDGDVVEREKADIREFLELTSEKIKLADDSLSRIRAALCEEFGTLRDAAGALDLSEGFVYDTLSNRHVPLGKLETVLDAIGLSRSKVSFERAMIRHGDSITVPDSFDEDLMYLLGVVFGDGDISFDRRDDNRGCVRVSNSNEELLERVIDIVDREFDKEIDVEYQDDKVPCVRIYSATIARLFANAGMETPKEDLSLHPELTTAEHADAFLRGLMDADGSVSSRSSGGSSVLLSTISERLASQVQLMLESYGVRARTRERDRRGEYELDDGDVIESRHVQYFVEIYGADIERYARAIGFSSARKQEQLQTVVGDATRRGEKIPIGSALATADGSSSDYHTYLSRGDNPGRDRAREMLKDVDLGDVEPMVEEAVDADLRWDEVVSAVDTGEKEVFDLTVPETHNFVGNGIVTHNTAAAVRDDFGEGQQWTLEAGALVLADQGVAAVDELDKMRCVTGETLVETEDGIRPIRELAFDADADEVESHENGRTLRGVDVRAWTMTDENRLTTRDVTAIHEYEAPSNLRDVTLESGESVTVTADHPFFVLEDGKRTEKAAEELQSGDWVYVPDSTPRPVSDGGVVTATSDDNATRPSLTPSHGAVMGYIAGDGNIFCDSNQGYGIRFTNKEEELLADFEQVCRDAFDAEAVRHPSEQRADGVETVHLHGKKYVRELIAAGLNLETYDGKRIPAAVAQGTQDVKAAFLRALADSEGSVDYHKVTITSASYELLLGAKMLLTEFGVTSQIQTEKRDGKRDIYTLAITAADSLHAFQRRIGFTLERKDKALASACEQASGNRTIIDVLPECGHLFEEARREFRLYQSECGLKDATYCNFENGEANFSLSKANRVLGRFEQRRKQASEDLTRMTSPCSWETLTSLKEQYHVSQSELADETEYSQQQISRCWGDNENLRETVQKRLHNIVKEVTLTDLSLLNEMLQGDVKWRRVSTVDEVSPSTEDSRTRILKHQLGDLLGITYGDAEATARELLNTTPNANSWAELRDELERHNISLQQLAEQMGVAGSTVSRWFNGVVDGKSLEDVQSVALDVIEKKRDRIGSLVSEIDERREPKVYDLTIEGTHNFLANGMVVHNSEDQSAMHEALEQQSISISKAGINATLKSRCSLLGAANPTYGRFDQYEPIGEQIDLEPPLISRFDLIFTVTDEPDEEEDAELAEHILQTNYAGELNTHRTETATSNYTEEEVEQVTDEVAPTIDPELLRKYVAYAKRNCYPTMTEEAKAEIQEFYVDLRAKGTGEDAPVPVTARKLEALVRLAEASARVRLSDTVEREDAQRAIEIARYCLEDIGLDPETGELDADVVETGTSKSQRDRIKSIKSLISQIEEEYDEGAPVDVVIERAEEEGMDASKAEHEIEKLRTKGEVYEPKTDHLRTT